MGRDRRRRWWRIAPLVVLSIAHAMPAKAETLRFDTGETSAAFSVRVAWVRRIEGRFGRIEGEVERAPDRPGLSIDVRIDAHAIDMNNPEHAEWARSAEFFDAEQHPWISFHAERVPEQLLIDGGELRGELSLRGVRRPQSLMLEPAGCHRPGLDCPIMARAELRRAEFGMTARRIAVADRVRLRLQIRLVP
jgi:polyisoprenoid-binding protein YceI